jgi:hypothetical protein
MRLAAGFGAGRLCALVLALDHPATVRAPALAPPPSTTVIVTCGKGDVLRAITGDGRVPLDSALQ